MTAPELVEVTKPGIYSDMPPETYHADPVPGGSLSSGGARRLLPPSCPAKFKHWLDHGEEAKRVCEFGNAAHLEVLGRGTPVAVIDVPDWRTKPARIQLAKAREDGLIPVKIEEWERIQGMVAALRDDRTAEPFLRPGSGEAEQSLFWTDPEFGIWRRSRLDYVLHTFYPDGRRIVVNYKTCDSVDDAKLQKSLVDNGFDQQAAWESDAAIALGLAPKGVAYAFVFQERKPPFVVSVLKADQVVIDRGRALNRWSMALFRLCRKAGIWPGYAQPLVLLGMLEEYLETGVWPARVGTLELPRWTETEFHDLVEKGVFEGLPGGRPDGEWRRPRA